MIGTTLNGRFLIEKELGRGGMGSVYRATDQVLERKVAIKVLKDVRGEEVGRKLRLEAQILARLVHDNIVRLYDFSVDGDTYYFIMEEVDGSSLFKRIKHLSVPERLKIARDVAEALDYAHHQGVIHRDVKPANILLTAGDQPKLSDFGLSVIGESVHEAGVARGTPHYMSPEQAKGQRVDHRTDLYALGIILYESATGATPFSGPPASVMAQHVNENPVPPRLKVASIPEDLDSLILELLAKQPDARPGRGYDVAERLRAILANFPDDSERDAEGGAVATGGERSAVGAGEAPARPAAAPIAPPPALSPFFASGSPVARALLAAVVAEPIQLQPEERYLAGHYLAYLLGGSRRQGLLLRRPLDPLNADRARLLLAMTALCLPGDTGVSMGQAVSLLDERPEIRPALNPIVVIKYLSQRMTPSKRKRFRQIRQQLQTASEYAARNLTDERGVLNPGLMPQRLADLQRLAPERTEIDVELVERWNLVAEVWRGNPEFRTAVLRYATKSAWRDPASIDLWPEVVYPLIERARRQRQLRSGVEVFWDEVCAKLLLRPDAGVRLDRQFVKAVPAPVIAELDETINAFTDEPILEDPAAEAADPDDPKITLSGPVSAAALEADTSSRRFVRIATAEPLRLTFGELRELWREAMAALRSGGSAQGHAPVAIGPYRLAVVATIRSRSAGQIALQGMPNKQLEMLIPPFTGGTGNNKPILAVWVHQNNSVVITYVDHIGTRRYILWDAANRQQTNFDDAVELNQTLYQLGLEVPDSLADVLSKNYQPKHPA